MDKRKVKMMSRALVVVKLNFPDIIQFINDCLAQDCSKENISVDGVIFYYKKKKKKLAQKSISYSLVLGFKAEKFSLHLTKYAKRYSMKLNSPNHDIFFMSFGFSLTKAFKDFFTHEFDQKNNVPKMSVTKYFYNP